MSELDSYPLTFVELSRWNAALREPLSCPRHRTPQPFVAGTHETAGHPMWICAECGYVTPVLEEEAVTTLGATDTFTDAAATAQLRPDTHLVVLPTGPGSDPATGTVSVQTADAGHDVARIAGLCAGVVAAVVMGVVTGMLPLPAIVRLLLLIGAGIGAGLVVFRTYLNRARTRHATITSPPRTICAGDLLAGQWCSRSSGYGGILRVARVLQVARIGATHQIRVITTATTHTLPDTTPLSVVEMAQADLNDFTYHPRG